MIVKASSFLFATGIILLITMPAAVFQTATGINPTSPSSASPTIAKPIAAFTYSSCVFCLAPGYLFSFNANWSATPSGTITLYTWNFGDGSPILNTTNPTTYHDSGPGPWKVTLTVTDSHEQTDTISQLVIFDIHPVFIYHPTRPLFNQPVIFNATDSISYDTNSPIKGYLWTLGDGTNATGAIIKHTYIAPGIYRVTLELVTPNGNPQISETISIGHRIFQGTFNNINVTVTGSLSLSTTTHTLTGTVDITATNMTSGATIFSKTLSFTITYSPNMNTAKFLLFIPTSAYNLGVGCAVNTSTSDTSCILSKNPDTANQGIVNIIDLATIAIAYDSTLNDPNWNSNADLNGDGIVGVVDLAITASNYGAIVLQ